MVNLMHQLLYEWAEKYLYPLFQRWSGQVGEEKKSLLPQVGIKAQTLAHPGCSTVILW